jgi:hypothetical protein
MTNNEPTPAPNPAPAPGVVGDAAASPPPPPSDAPGPSSGPGASAGAPPTGAGAPPMGAGAPPMGAGAPPSWSEPWSWSDRREPRPAGLVLGIILVVTGAAFLILQLGNITLGPDAWPLWLVVPGLAMLVGSLFIPARGGLGLAVPGAILAAVGAILWVQSVYDVYATWAYAWALVAPTAPGIAMIVYGGARGDVDLLRDGLRATLTGIGLFLGFALFFEGVIGISGHRIANLDTVLPYAAIVLGVLFIVLAVVDGGRRDQWREQRRAEREADRQRRRAEKAARRASRLG